MRKLTEGRKRKGHCPKFCKETGCFDKTEKRSWDGKEYIVWVHYCKALDRVHKKVLGK